MDIGAVLIMSDMAVKSGAKRDRGRAQSEKISIRVADDVPQRLRVAAAQAGMSQGAFLEAALDRHEAALARKAQLAASPLHAGAVNP